jgi:hypothetical protein
MVAINSIPQQEVAKGRGHREFFRASPTTFSSEVAKNPAPSTPSGASAIFISVMLSVLELVREGFYPLLPNIYALIKVYFLRLISG